MLKRVPEEYRLHAHHWLILHGRYTCKARTPLCPACVVADLCTFKGKTEVNTEGPPEVYGMNLGCRAAVIFSPWDMSCGWDEHTHPHGNRLQPGDAIRMGINLVSYVAALRQSTTLAVPTFARGSPRLGAVVHRLTSRSGSRYGSGCSSTL